jgi:hypothetical protein
MSERFILGQFWRRAAVEPRAMDRCTPQKRDPSEGCTKIS